MFRRHLGLLILPLGFLILTSCGKDDSSGGSSFPFGSAIQRQSGSSGSSSSEDLKYQISITVNGVYCTTGPQEFSSRQAYCDGLQNDALNNSCASSQRYDKFLANCPDKVWGKPVDPQSLPETKQTPTEYTVFYTPRPTLPRQTLVEKVNKDQSQFTPANTGELNHLAQAYLDCGFRNSAPVCLDGEFIPSSIEPDFVAVNNVHYFISTFQNRSQTQTYLVVLEFVKDAMDKYGRGVLNQSVKVAPIATGLSDSALQKMFADGKFSPALELKLPAKPTELAVRELAHHWDYRLVFHYSEFILNLYEDNTKEKKVVRDVLSQQAHSIITAGSLPYQRALLVLTRDYFGDTDLPVKVSQELINSPDGLVSRTAAVTLGAGGQKSPRIIKI